MSKIKIIPNQRSVSASMKESRSSFLCPSNCVMTGRWHKGDENGQTQYEYATLRAVDESGNPVSGTNPTAPLKHRQTTLLSAENIVVMKTDKQNMLQPL